MRYILLTMLSIFLISCSILEKNNNYKKDWDLFLETEIGKDSSEIIVKRFGKPDEVDNRLTLPEHMEANEEQWSYMRSGTPKIGVYFNNGILEAISMDVWDGEEVIVLANLLNKFHGKWRVEQEPVTIPHAMPFLCYMIDDSSGKQIEIHGYKKIVESISKFSLRVLKERKKYRKKSKAYPDVDPNRCDWLAEYLKSKGLLARGTPL